MELKDQVCNWKVAKRFKELGVKQDSLWYWVEEYHWSQDGETKIKTNSGKFTLEACEEYIPKDFVRYSAFTVAELGEKFKNMDWDCYYRAGCSSDGSYIASYYWNSGNNKKEFIADTEANARAKLLIYLLEHKLIKEEKDGT